MSELLILRSNVYSLANPFSLLDYFMKESEIIDEVAPFQYYSLPVVKKYFPFANALALSFLQPIEVVTLTSRGSIIINDKEGISIHVPDGAVPVRRRMHLEIGSAMHGNFSFPENMQPVSPILWMCPQEDIALQKPFKITLPHAVKYEEGTSELVFLKACHEQLPGTASVECKTFEFEQMTDYKRIEFNERNGSAFTQWFCCLCIAENVSKPVPKKYFLFRTQPPSCNASRFAVDYCITYDLPTCIRVSSARSISSREAVREHVIAK